MSVVLLAPASAQDITLPRLTTSDGLSQSTIQAILQDRNGFMWFATSDGLNRYDGYEFVVYNHDPQNPNSPGSELISCLYEDAEGYLWLCAGSAGLDRFDPVTGSFTHYRHDPADSGSLSSDDVAFVQPADDGHLWVGTLQNGLNLFDPATGRATRFRPTSDGSSTFMSKVAKSADGTIWIAATLLLELDSTGTLIPRFSEQIEGIRDILPDNDGGLWVGTSHGLAHVDPATDRIQLYAPSPDAHGDASANNVDVILENEDGTFWIGTPGGLYRFDPDAGAFVQHHKHDPAHPGSLVSSAVSALYRDETGLLWIGTTDGGLSLLDPRRTGFTYYLHRVANDQSLFEPNVHAIHVDDDNTVWLGTSKGVLTRFDPDRDRYVHYRHDPADPGSLSPGYFIRAITRDAAGTLWVGGWNAGVNRLGPSGRFTHFMESDSGLTSNNVLDIHADSHGYVWIGTMYGGLNRYDPATGIFHVYRHDPDDPTSLSADAVNVLYEARDGTLWAGTWTGGLNRYDRERDAFVHYRHVAGDQRSLPPGGVNAVIETAAGTIWVGTTGGLARFEPENGRFVRITEHDGLADGGVQAMLEDECGRLWISTRRGLTSFDPVTGRVRNYDVSDGLPSNDFHDGAAARGPDGQLYFGTNKGLLVFDPDHIEADPHVPRVVFTDLRIQNEQVTAGSDRLPRAIWKTDSLTLTHRDVVFSISFAALSYSAPEKSRYRYRLAGLETAWNEVDSRRREARYSSLPAGSYVFEVQAANADGTWNTSGAALQLTVLPPWWGTWWFRTLAIALAFGLVAGAAGWRLHTVEARRRELAHQVEVRTHQLAEAKEAAEAASRAKSSFLANMSHELRTPLGAVLGFTEVMLREGQANSTHREHLSVVRRSAMHLLDLINDVLDMSKVESGRLTVELGTVDLQELLRNLHDLFSLRAKKSGLRLTFQQDNDLPRYVVTDERKLRQVLLNLLSNALKFTEEGEVTLRAGYAGDFLEIEVADTGPGIDPADAEQIFAPFVQTRTGRRQREGTGLGLSISRRFAEIMGGTLTLSSVPGEGATFSLAIPAPRSIPSAEPANGELQGLIRLAPNQNAPRMLVVDDQADNRNLLATILLSAGFEVRTVEDGAAALDLAASWAPRLVLLDRRMPGMSGDEVVARLRSMPERMTVVALTASTLTPGQGDLDQLGYDDYLAKPFTQGQLFELLGRHLEVQFDEGEASDPVSNEMLRPGELHDLPDSWKEAFRHAVVRGHTNEMLDLARRLESASPRLAGRIEHHVRRFEFEALVAALEEVAWSHGN